MLATIVIFLLVACLIIAAVVCFMFLSVAFAGPQWATAAVAKQTWQPPLDNNDTLAQWAARMAASVTTRQMSLTRSRTTATRIAHELYAGAADAMEQLREQEGQCSARCHEMIGVTAPEALAIADNLRTELGGGDVARIRHTATENTAKTDGMNRVQYTEAQVTCPLLTNDGTCAAYPFRPLFCRTDCAVCGDEDPAERQRRVSSSSLALGIGRGLSKSLAAAGVDGNRYELNSALFAALDTPDVSERWAKGERVFAECKRFVV